MHYGLLLSIDPKLNRYGYIPGQIHVQQPQHRKIPASWYSLQHRVHEFYNADDQETHTVTMEERNGLFWYASNSTLMPATSGGQQSEVLVYSVHQKLTNWPRKKISLLVQTSTHNNSTRWKAIQILRPVLYPFEPQESSPT